MSAFRVLITGFGPFLDIEENPSALLAERLRESAVQKFLRLDLTAHIIPTEWQRARHTFNTLLAAHDPDLLLHFGVDRDAAKIRLERQAKNCSSLTADAAGVCGNAGAIIDGAPAALTTTLPADAMAESLNRANIPAEPSSNAGDYLCNFLYFLSLAHCAGSERARHSGFVHIPKPAPHTTEGGMTLEQIETGALRIIEMSLDHARAGQINLV